MLSALTTLFTALVGIMIVPGTFMRSKSKLNVARLASCASPRNLTRIINFVDFFCLFMTISQQMRSVLLFLMCVVVSHGGPTNPSSRDTVGMA